MLITRNRFILKRRNYISKIFFWVLAICLLVVLKFSLINENVNIFPFIFISFIVFESVMIYMDVGIFKNTYNKYIEGSERIFINKYFLFLSHLGEELSGAVSLKQYPYLTILEYRQKRYLHIKIKRRNENLNKNIVNNIRGIVEGNLEVKGTEIRKSAIAFWVCIPAEKITDDSDDYLELVNSCEIIGERLVSERII